MKDGSSSQQKRVSGTSGAAAVQQNSLNHKDLTMRGAREEAKTIDTPTVTTGSAGQAKRGSRASTSNADLLKQSIRSEKVIKSSLNAKKQKDKSNVAGVGGQSATSKNGGGNGNDEQQDGGDSMVKLAMSESADGQAQSANNEEETKAPAVEPKNKSLEDVKTVSFHENAGTITADLAAATASSAEKPPVALKMPGGT